MYAFFTISRKSTNRKLRMSSLRYTTRVSPLLGWRTSRKLNNSRSTRDINLMASS